MTKKELTLFISFLPQYTAYFQEHRQSILARIYGIFTVNSNHYNKVHVMLMENTAQLKMPENLTYIFDLKGSSVDRKT